MASPRGNWASSADKSGRLTDEDPQEHESAAEHGSTVVGLAQQPPTSDRREDRLEAEQDRDVGGRALALRDDLKKECDPDREDPGIEDLPGRLAKGPTNAEGLLWSLDQNGRDKGCDGNDRELEYGQFDRIGLGRISPNDLNLNGPANRPEQNQQRGHVNLKTRIAGFDTEKPHSHDRQAASDPGRKARSHTDHQTDQRREHHVEAGDEASRACFRTDNSILLEGRREGDHQSNQDRPLNEDDPLLAPIFGRGSRIDPREEEPEGRDRECADRKSDRRKGQRSDRVHGLFLGDESKTPDRGREEHQEVCGDGRQAHQRTVASAPVSGRLRVDDRRRFLRFTSNRGVIEEYGGRHQASAGCRCTQIQTDEDSMPTSL